MTAGTAQRVASSLVAGAWRRLNWTAHETDTSAGAIHSLASNTDKFLAPTAGWYFAGIGVMWDTTTAVGSSKYVRIVRLSDGVSLIEHSAENLSSGAQGRMLAAMPLYLAAGDGVAFDLFHNDSQARSLAGGGGLAAPTAWLLKLAS